jgi:TetR/AcrR family transcriptional regulator, cholesterol catabolism regulator
MDEGLGLKDIVRLHRLSMEEMCEEILDRHQDTFRALRRKSAIRNLQKIVTATLKISNRKGFRSMSLRDLSQETGLSMGTLYNYFDSKETLLLMIVRQVLAVTERVFDNSQPSSLAKDRLKNFIVTHVYWSEAIMPWLFFVNMEARDFHKEALEYARKGEIHTEDLLAQLLLNGVQDGSFKVRDARVEAVLIKSLVQCWYMKRWKFRPRGTPISEFVDAVTNFVTASLDNLDRQPG